jgi:hypothetical protein
MAMSIHEMNATEVLQHCGKCSAENRVVLDSLEAGVTRDDQTDPHIVPLPACPSCRSTEFLIRSPDDEAAHPAPGSFGHLHRLLVDQVHAELVKRKKVVPALKDKQGRVDPALAKPLSNDDVQRWFPTGLKIAVRDTETPSTAKETAQ